ncbi:START-like domain-containing protein [Maribellus sp. YY47]|uniref:START-like domain-containing protein n=1 Tax=Maribellus sp. YY47 TaxID=2929486 RepID=UPI0020015930|nr:START-like domain-containing protein [Maribellus sp. YY47]MCK3682789.1 START-like domain-containing protein [Maribellus sp. YY47]
MPDKIRFQIEFLINCSPKVLYNRLSTASGLTEWFADDVRVKGRKYTFVWDETEQTAEMTMQKENRLVRFNWLDEDDDTYFEFRITQDELTGDVSLLITDFSEEGEEQETKDLWETQVADLKHVLGS